MAQESRLIAFEQALKDEGIKGTDLESVARSIFQQESSSGANIKTSNAGARGPMQVLPATFKAYNPQGNIDNPYDNSVGGLRYIKDLFNKTGDLGLTAVGYYGGPKAIEKAKKGVAVSDPRNPNAPNTLQYMEQVMGRAKGTPARQQQRPAVPKPIREAAPELGPNYQAALALMAKADDLNEAREKIAEEEELAADPDFSQARQMLAQIQPISGFVAQEPRRMFAGGEATKDEELSPSLRFQSLEKPKDYNLESGVYQQDTQGMMGRIGGEYRSKDSSYRAGASAVAVKLPDGSIKLIPAAYDVGYSTKMGPGELELSGHRSIQSMPGRGHDWGARVNYRIPIGKAEGGEAKKESPSTGERLKGTAKEILRSMQYAPYDLLGAPVDVGNLALKGVDYVTGSKLATEKPVGGSEYLIQKSRELGIADEPTGSTTETLTRLGTGIVSPTAGPRAVASAAKAVKGTAKAALEDLAMAGTGQGGSKVAQQIMAPGTAFAVPPSTSKQALQQLDASMVRPSEQSPFVGKLEQTLFDNPQEVFTPQQLMGWAKKNLPGQDADRLEKAIQPLMGQKRITKQEALEAVNTTYSPKQFTLEITKPNEPVRGNPYLQTYAGSDFPYIGATDVKSTGLIIVKKPAQDIGQLRLEGALESIASHPKALDNYFSGADTKTAPGNLMNIKNYIDNLSLDSQTKKQAAGLIDQFATSNQELANAKQIEKYFSEYLAKKPELDLQEQISSLDEIAKGLRLDTTLLRPEQIEKDIQTALYQAQNYGAREAAMARDQLKQFVQNISPEESRFFAGRPEHDFQGANAVGFSRYADLTVDGKNLIGISEFQSDLRRTLKESRLSPLNKTPKEAERIEMFPNMEKRPEVITQNLIKNSIYAAAKLDKDGLVLPGTMSAKPELYANIQKQAKAALKDMGLDSSYLKPIDPRKVYDKQQLEQKMLAYHNNNVDTGKEIYDIKDLSYEQQQDLLTHFSPYVIYLPKKEQKSILQFGIPYKKGGMVDKNDVRDQKYI